MPVHVKFEGKSKATTNMNKTLKLGFLSKQLLPRLVLTVVQMYSIKRNQWDQEGGIKFNYIFFICHTIEPRAFPMSILS